MTGSSTKRGSATAVIRSFRITRSAALVLACLLASCAAKRESMREGHALTAMENESALQLRAAEPAGRLLIKKAGLSVVVTSVSDALSAAVRVVETAGGYTQESRTDNGNRAHADFRVPADHLDEVIEQLADLGKETSRHVEAEDETDQVGDLEAELANKRALRNRLRALLSRAKDVKEVLAVEAELTRVQTDIDAMETRLARLRKDIAFSSISFELCPTQPEKKARILGPLGYLYTGTKWFVIKLFVIRWGDE